MNEAPPNLFNILMKGYERNSMMGCSIEPDPNVLEAETREGLIKGHAYSITKVELMDIITPNTSGKIPMVSVLALVALKAFSPAHISCYFRYVCAIHGAMKQNGEVKPNVTKEYSNQK